MTDLTFSFGNRQRFVISASVVEQLHRYRQTTFSRPESGGVLLGRMLIESNHVIVDKVTVPSNNDRCTRTSFYRSQQAHQREIDKAWKESEGTCNYLGEWHTHPESHPTPSSIDLHNWKIRLSKDRFDSSQLFFIIIGTASINAWIGIRWSGKIIQIFNTSGDKNGKTKEAL